MSDDTAIALTLQEAASLTSGRDFWHSKGVERAGVPPLLLTDGPHGVRKQREGSELGLADSVPSTCFPPAAGLASSFDAGLMRRVGEALGREAAYEGVGVLLGPGINIKRSPLCGRNFEYFSEDPLLSGVMGAAWVGGVQSNGVGASLKHFAANNQETDRMRVSSDVDERTLREIYLRAFQHVVERAQPWTVMCSYNKINGVPVSESRWLLTQVLRDEWGFDGVVMSDWGAVDDRVRSIVAGLDLEMPTSGGRTDAELVAAVENGSLEAGVVQRSARRMLRLSERCGSRRAADEAVDVDGHHALAREAAGRSIVLLKNDGNLLPLHPDARLAVIGAFAADPRFQGAGSSLINPTRLDRAVDEIRAISTGEVLYAPGFSLDASGDDPASLREEAVRAAADAEAAVVFLGLPSADESEGFDRTHIDLPAAQLRLLDAVLEVNPRTVVVLSHGGVVALPFAERVPAILDGWLLGQAGGGATADVLFGRVNPSGRLAETIPVRLADTPSALAFPGDFGHVRYAEGLFVGYRGYDARQTAVAFPFGHGLSYTSFNYSDVEAREVAGDEVEISLIVRNTGGRAGREVVQVYAGLPGSAVSRAVRELAAFAVVALEPDESRRVTLPVRTRDLAYWDTRVQTWVLEPGRYRFEVAASSRDIRASLDVDIAGDDVRIPLSEESALSEVAVDERAMSIVREIAAGRGAEGAILLRLFDPEDEIGMLNASFPVGRLGMAGITRQEIGSILGH